MTYYAHGWYDGESDCDPPELGKRWMAVVDEDGEEICIVVQRKRRPTSNQRSGSLEYQPEDTKNADHKVHLIVDALNNQANIAPT